MWRILPVILFIGFLAGLVIVFLIIVPSVQRRARRDAVKDAAEADLVRFQNRTSMEDLARHRERMNQGIDEQYEAMRKAKGAGGDTPQ